MAKSANIAEVRTYELTYLVPTSFTDSEVTKIADQIGQLLTKHKGQVVKADNWGKKKLAYRIKHGSSYHQDAYYLHVVFSAPADQVQAFEKAVYLQPNLIRHLLVVAEVLKATKAVAPQTEVAEA